MTPAEKIRVRGGYPTKASMQALCIRHKLNIYAMDFYSYKHCINWAGGDMNNQAAEKVSKELRDAGFKVSFRPYFSVSGITGQLKIERLGV